MKSDYQFFQCECQSESIRVEKFEDFITGEDGKKIKDNSFYFSIWKAGIFNYKPSLLDRIKTALYFIVNGTYHTDQILLSEETTRELSKYLKKLLNEGK